MKLSAVPVIAIAGLACSALAQNIATVTLTSSDHTAPIGGVFTIGVVLSDNISGNSVFGFDLMIEGFGPGVAIPMDPTPDAGIFGFSGSASGSTVTGLGGASDILGPTLDASLDGVTVFSFQVTTAITCGNYEFTVSDGPGPNSAVQWGQEGGIVILPAEYDEIVFNNLTVFINPSPATTPLLALAAPLAVRRRR